MRYEHKIEMHSNFKQINDVVRILHIESDDIDANKLVYFANSIPDIDVFIHRVRSISEARQTLKHETFDLCISDIWLRTQLSLPLLQELSSTCNDLPVIILTNITNNLMIDEGISQGAQYFLGKEELCVASLSHALEQAIGGQGLFRERRPTPDLAQTVRPKVHEKTGAIHIETPDLRAVQPESDPDAGLREAPSLDELRAQVTALHYELDPIVHLSRRSCRSACRDIIHVCDVVDDAIKAMAPILERKQQSASFTFSNFYPITTPDPINTMIILIELLHLVSQETIRNNQISIDLSSHTGRTQVRISGKARPGALPDKITLPGFFEPFFGRGKFSQTVTLIENSVLELTLTFPMRFN